ncbi:MAG TPA: hypothetical protein VNN09_15070 [Candidatus Competibacteraceae bacterium]|nr:hypothetical protein [Candidatus Competibacteraceae bacterium]
MPWLLERSEDNGQTWQPEPDAGPFETVEAAMEAAEQRREQERARAGEEETLWRIKASDGGTAEKPEEPPPTGSGRQAE